MAELARKIVGREADFCELIQGTAPGRPRTSPDTPLFELIKGRLSRPLIPGLRRAIPWMIPRGATTTNFIQAWPRPVTGSPPVRGAGEPHMGRFGSLLHGKD